MCSATERYRKGHGCIACIRRNGRRRRAHLPKLTLHNWGWCCSRVVNALRQAAGGIVSYDELIEAVWRSPADGGPDYALAIVRKAVFQLRRLGYPIETHHTRGYSYAWSTWQVDPAPP
jgi:hypothetical protein